MTKTEEARQFASEGFRSIDHKRKYTGLPYEVHTDEVANIVASVTLDEDMICAAYLHDTVEDVNVYPYNLEGIEERFGERVSRYVLELTDRYTKEDYPNFNRKVRKGLEAARLGKISKGAKTVKLADLISNTKDIVKNDPEFAKTYLKEKEIILPNLIEGDRELWLQANAILKEHQQ